MMAPIRSYSLSGVLVLVSVAFSATFLILDALYQRYVDVPVGAPERQVEQAKYLARLLGHAVNTQLPPGDVEQLDELVSRYAAAPDVVAIALLDDTARVLVSTRPGWRGQAMDDGGQGIDNALFREVSTQRTERVSDGTHGGVRIWLPVQLPNPMGERHSRNFGVLLLDYAQMAPARSWQEPRNWLRWLSALGLSSLLVMWVIRYTLFRPIYALGEGMRALAGGNLGMRIDLAGDGDLARLARQLNHMAARIETVTGASERARSETEAILQASTDGILAIDRTGRVANYNAQFLAIWRITAPAGPLLEMPQLRAAMVGLLPPGETFVSTLQVTAEQAGHLSHANLTLVDGRVLECDSRPQMLDGKAIGRVWGFRDLTHLYRARRELAASEEKYRALFENSEDGMALFSHAGISMINAAGVRMLGFGSPTEVLGMHPADLSPPVQADGVESKVLSERLIDEIMRAGARRLEWQFQHRDGSIIDVDVSITRIRHADRDVLAAVWRDVTARKDTEHTLREQKAFIDAAMDAAANVIVVLDRDGRFVRFNGAAEKLTGYRAEEVLGQLFWELFIPADELEHVGKAFAAIIAGQTQMGDRFENHWLVRDGGSRLLEWRNSVLRDPQGCITHVVSLGYDITEKVAAELALEGYRERLEELVDARTAELGDAEARLRLILESTADGVFGLDAHGRFTFANAAACEMLGYTQDELLGRRSHATIHHSHADGSIYPTADCRMGKALFYGNETRVEGEVFWTRDGRSIPVEYATRPMLREAQIVGAVISFRDISQRRQLDEMRAKALAEAEQLARVKSEFLANMSHEIRTPLNAVLGLSRVGMQEMKGQPAAARFERIYKSGKHLLGVIGDILDFSRLEAGKVHAEHGPLCLQRTVDDAIHFVSASAKEKNLELRVSCAPDLPAWIIGDALRIAQVLTNLLGNAVKFTESGSISLEVERADDRLEFIVADTGIGMQAEQLARVFDPFEQADGSTTRRFGGSGLGLAISRDLARAMGGDLVASSELGVGSRFTLSLPLEPVDASLVADHPGREQGPRLPGLRVLAVEDNEVNRLVLRELLSLEGAVMTFAEHGRQALDVLHASGAAAFDIVLMDVQMPVMDGYQATRAMASIAPQLPVIGLTAHALAEERQRCLDSGMRDHVTKPVDVDLLVDTIRRHVSVAGVVTAGAGSQSTATPDLPSLPGIDVADGLRRLRGKVAAYRRILGHFASQYTGYAEEMTALLGASDWPAALRLAHSLKGVAANIGAIELSAAAAALEQQCRSEDMDAAQACLQVVAGALHEVMTGLAVLAPVE